ncbi:hypothetical protein ROA7023_03345 [Roseisalinus antarcticus]|uniref:Uncharacterized protein n=2 Tax=Roseisalinus antarcticus TaxID=254357 RepID=A0A1Y5TS97_9RHOB|nr:hypothetical protein ROA7023_03345 [Roseisalinus antarcticus]
MPGGLPDLPCGHGALRGAFRLPADGTRHPVPARILASLGEEIAESGA